jgi:RNA polymerase sigma factor (TIGR02999 family)
MLAPQDALDQQSETHEVTELLLAWRRGDRAAYNHLIEKVYRELRQLAERSLGMGLRGDLCPTELVNMAYVKLMGAGQVDWQNRGHFFAVAAQAMRWLAMDWLDEYQARERRGQVVPLDKSPADQFEDMMTVSPELWLALSQALTRLEAFGGRYERAARLVELRCFGGFSIEEAADLLEVDRATAYRDWRFARAWLRLALFGKEEK